MRRSDDFDLAIRAQFFNEFVDQTRIDQRLVALDINYVGELVSPFLRLRQRDRFRFDAVSEVSATSAPQSKAAFAIRISSVAMITESNFSARRQRSQTWRRSGLPAIRYSGLPGKRVDPQRAGIIPTALLICKIDDYLRGCQRDHARPMSATVSVVSLSKSSLNTDCADAGVATALSVDLFVADKERTRSDRSGALGLACQDHSRCRFAAIGMLTGNVGTKISCIDQIRSEFMQHFRLDGAILLHRDKSAPDPALIRNDDEFEAFGFQTAQCFRDAGENLNLFRIGTIIGIVHYGSVAIDKDGGRTIYQPRSESSRKLETSSSLRHGRCPKFADDNGAAVIGDFRPLRSALPRKRARA